MEHMQSPNTAKSQQRGKQKRKLHLVKCDRCRFDKQKCTPTTRLWPTKCDRCVQKGFPCSTGQRLERPTKFQPGPKVVEDDATHRNRKDSESMEDCDNLLLLLDFLDVLHLARQRLCALETDMLSIFSMHLPSAHHWSSSRRRDKKKLELNIMIEEVKDSITSTKKDIMNSATRSDLARIVEAIISTSLGDDGVKISTFSKCLFCFPEEDFPADELRNLKFRNSRFLLQHRRFDLSSVYALDHRLANHFFGKNLDVRPEEVEDLMTLSSSLASFSESTGCATLAKLTAATLRPFVTFTIRYVAECVEGFRWLGSSLKHMSEMNGKDCLGRTFLHQYFDVSSEADLMLLHYTEPLAKHIESFTAGYDEQDCLGRTLLHIACRNRQANLVEWLIKQGASLDKCTTYGHTPLHYAAANGSTHLCKMLLNGKDSFNVDQKDFTGRTASDYAKGQCFSEILHLISSARAEDGYATIPWEI